MGVKPEIGESRKEKKEHFTWSAAIIETYCHSCHIQDLPENFGRMENGVCPLSVLNMYWIQLVALH